MRTFQRYAFWVIGWALLAYGAYQFIYTIKLTIEQAERTSTDKNIMEWIEVFILSAGFILQTFAVALFCMFLARICKLEDDPEFKAQLNTLVRNIRSAGKKHG